MVAKGSGVSAAIVATLIGLATGACSTATPYQPDIAGQRVAGGYSETKIGEDRYRVNFEGNSLTSRDRVEGYLLYRAAELTIRDGYDWFLIVDRLTEHDVETYVAPDPLYRPWYGNRYGYWRPHWRYHQGRLGWQNWHPEIGERFWAGGVDIRTVEQFEAHAELVMRRGAVPAGEERAFNARRVIRDLGPTVERPRPRAR
jgi:hypothetical protein